MINIGVTGSLASGKSTVAKILANRKHKIFNADEAVSDLYKKKKFKKKIIKEFNLVNSKNIKKKIKNLIKKDKKKLKKLETIIHPIIRMKMKTLMRHKKRGKIIIFDIPLLIESKLGKYFDVIIFVGSKKKIRLKRYLRKKGTKQIFTILDKRQAKSNKKIKNCDYIIYNNRSLKVLRKKVKLLMKRI